MEVGELDELEVHGTPPVPLPLLLGVLVLVGVVSRRGVVEEAQSVALVFCGGSRRERGNEEGGNTKGDGVSACEAVGIRCVHLIFSTATPPGHHDSINRRFVHQGSEPHRRIDEARSHTSLRQETSPSLLHLSAP